MSSTNLIYAYRELVNSQLTLKAKYLDNYLSFEGSMASHEEFEIDVKAYCVLFHAALEGFVEGVAYYISEMAFDKYLTKKEVTVALFSLYFYTPELCGGMKDVSSWDKLYDNIRDSYNDKAKKLVQELLENNHGASVKYMKKLLMRFGIDLNISDPLFESLQRLVNARGEYAHWDISHVRGRTRTKRISPDDALTYSKDCLELALKIIYKGAKSSSDNQTMSQYLGLVLRSVHLQKQSN